MTEIFTAKRVEDAKKMAVEHFGVSEDQIVFRILEEPKKGFLGFGKKGEAKIEAIYEPPVAAAAEAEKVLFSHVVHLLSVVLEHLEECVVDDVERKQRDAEHNKPLATKGEVAARCVAGRNECQRGDESADTGREDLCNPDGRNENRSVNLPVHLVLLSLEGLRRLNDCAAVFAAVLALAPCGFHTAVAHVVSHESLVRVVVLLERLPEDV